ncbi:hypothetical protein FTW19_17665 [Terriglobus albidus]|uniref:Uncharacterized protein n=1 Tax=Terriglobus albidus TaxID=1592106 RepID=A0A5B9EBV4_9BACT|nr:Imm42 family immunity protein [Terriglobus albidus]QEE29653.1 hypothetical protein FTW19_17665 [Terriglobus albidus]
MFSARPEQWRIPLEWLNGREGRHKDEQYPEQRKEATQMIIGDPSIFAIESIISKVSEDQGLRRLGYFFIHISGFEFGVRTRSATMLANSFDEVGRRISGRGKHIANFSRSYSAQEIAVAAHAVLYAEGIPLSQLLGQPTEAVLNEIENARLVWAPDGDAAFDDGSIVLQMDVDREVRLIGFRNSGLQFSEIGDVSEAWLDSKVYYDDVLNEWARQFVEEWESLLR